MFPEADEDDDEIEIDPKDLKIDIFMSSGPGGQSVNTTYSAVRMTHIPTGIVVSMQDEKSQIQNRAAALRVLKSRLLAMKHEQEAAEAADMRHSQVRSLDRSERIRTYNFPENRIADHRTGYKAYNLDQVMDGALARAAALGCQTVALETFSRENVPIYLHFGFQLKQVHTCGAFTEYRLLKPLE